MKSKYLIDFKYFFYRGILIGSHDILEEINGEKLDKIAMSFAQRLPNESTLRQWGKRFGSFILFSRLTRSLRDWSIVREDYFITAKQGRASFPRHCRF